MNARHKKSRSTLIEYFLLCIAFVWGIIGFSLAYIFGEGLWFSRSGSVIVLLCAIVEFRLSSLRQKSYEDPKFALKEGIMTSGMLPPEKKWVSIFAHIQVVVGTIIWGYGDLLFVSNS